MRIQWSSALVPGEACDKESIVGKEEYCGQKEEDMQMSWGQGTWRNT